MKTKHIIILLVAFSCSSVYAGAQGFLDYFPKFNIGIHTGMDIGAAAPYPPSSIGGGSKISAVPYLTPALGLSANLGIDNRWSVSLEATYKKFGIEARAWVPDQNFRDPDDPSAIVKFRGTADILMRFTMLEVPLYAGYTFDRGERNRVFLGAYYAYVFQSRFSAAPIKGLVSNPDNPGEFVSVSPEEPFDPQNFDKDMGKWDIGILMGYEWKVAERVFLGARLSVGFKDIFRSDSRSLDYKMIHMRGSVVLSYRLFNIK